MTYIVFESVFRSNAVDFLYRIGRYILACRLTVIDHQQLVILLVGCRKTDCVKVTLRHNASIEQTCDEL